MVVATVLGCVFLLQVSSVILNEVCYQKKILPLTIDFTEL